MRSAIKTTIFLFLFLFLSFNKILADDSLVKNTTFWIKVIDQNEHPITDAKVYYCIGECYQKPLEQFTDENGLLGFSISKEKGVQIAAIVKEGFDIRLSTLEYDTIRLEGTSDNIKINRLSRGGMIIGGFTVSFSPDVTTYTIPSSAPISIITGWKLGNPGCFERGRIAIDPDGPQCGTGEKCWDFADKEYYYLVGGSTSSLRKGNSSNYDFKITVNRKWYPWGNILFALLANYQLDVEFYNGGMSKIDKGKYIHEAPVNGYSKKTTIFYRGIGKLSRAHLERFFIKIDDRYGIMYLNIIPSQQLFFDFILSRKEKQNILNIPVYYDETLIEKDYFYCHYKSHNLITPLRECARLGVDPCFY